MRTKVAMALALLPAAALLVAGCMVPASKYKAVQAENDSLKKLLDDKEKEINTQQDAFRKRFEDASRQLELYKKQATAPKPETEKAVKAVDDERKKWEDQIRALGIGDVRDGRLVLQGELVFDTGKTTVSKRGAQALDKIAAAFKAKDVIIQIDGHTDATPVKRPTSLRVYGDNMGLGADRALAVFRYLAKKGIPEKNMFVRSFGESWPVAGNATEPSRAKNRRVEILFIPASLVPRASAK
ncbi:MAG TPA: OmpA family protein [Planctomycetota bacterium]|nr:OmpA family protein [Planctomycetota bacterium]